MNKKPLSLTAIRRVRAAMAVRRFALGVATGLVLAAPLLASFMAWSEPAAHSDVGVAQSQTGGMQIDTLIITDHLYLHGAGGKLVEISVGTDASGKDVVTATPAGGQWSGCVHRLRDRSFLPGVARLLSARLITP